MNKKFLILITISLFGNACVSFNSEPNKPPVFDEDTSISDAVEAAIEYGGPTLEKAKKLITKRNGWKEAIEITGDSLDSPSGIATGSKLLRTVHLYQTKSKTIDLEIVKALVRSERQIAIQAGWQLAANYPTMATKELVSSELTRIIMRGDEKKHFVEQLAMAVSANNVTNAYTFMRQALMATGLPSVAEAMAKIAPEKASDDFLEYLALAPIEELRQLTQKTVNVYSCRVAFKHFLKYPVSINHPKSQILFLYSVSRNTALSDLAREALQFGVEGRSSDAALLLARLPVWIQVAFIEGVRRSPFPKLNLLLGELRKVSAEEDVVAEIAEVLR